MPTWLYYLFGIVCSLCYGWAAILENRAALNQSKIDSLNPSHLYKLFKQLPYILGILLDLIGWLFFLVVAKYLPLFLAMSFVSLGLIMTALINSLFYKVKTKLTEYLAMLGVIIGIVAMSIIAKPSTSLHLDKTFIIYLLLLPLLFTLGGLVVLKGKKKKEATILAGLSGISFSMTGILSRLLDHNYLNWPYYYPLIIIVLIIFAAIGALYYAAALQRSRLNQVNSVVYGIELIIPSLIGIIYLNDQVKKGTWTILILAVTLVFISVLFVAKRQAD